MKYCSLCGELTKLEIPAGDNKERSVCTNCEEIHYENPRIIVCTVPCFEDKVLLCKRAIEPRHGYWTVPGGFMENDETTQEGAIRETWEEANASVSLHDIYALYNLPHINQVHVFFRATLNKIDFSPGEESLEVELFKQNEIPWNDIAFSPVKNVLENYFLDRVKEHYPMRCANIRIDKNNKRFIEYL